MSTVILIAQINQDDKMQARRYGLEGSVVYDYADLMKAGTVFPPVVVFCDGTMPVVYWLADGFHRVAAAKEAGAVEIAAEVRAGTKRDAMLYANGEANRDHGLQLTRLDKRNRVLNMIEDKEWTNWSNRQIAAHCGVSHTFVANLRDTHNLSVNAQRGNVTTPKPEPTQQQPVEQGGNVATSAAFYEGQTVITRTGHVGTVESINGGHIYVTTANGTKPHHAKDLTMIPDSEQPVQSAESGNVASDEKDSEPFNIFNIGDRVQREGVTGTVRYLKGEKVGFYSDVSHTTHYYHWSQFKLVAEATPIEVDTYQVALVVAGQIIQSHQTEFLEDQYGEDVASEIREHLRSLASSLIQEADTEPTPIPITEFAVGRPRGASYSAWRGW